MKKWFIPCITAAVLLTGSVSADELPYIRQLPQYTYISSTLMSQESYPEVCIRPGYAYSLFRGSSAEEPLFLCFPGPQGAMAESFSTSEAYYLDDANAIQYQYYVTGSDSYEEFINKAEDDSWILREGADGTAARIDPERLKGYGMIGAKEFGKSAKLVIQVGLDKLDRKMPLEQRTQALSDAILAEVDRIVQTMHYETLAPYWNSGKYAGVKFLDTDFQHLFKLDLPVISITAQDGSTLDGNFIIEMIDGMGMDGIIDFGNGTYIEADIDIDTYSYAISKQEENNPDVSEQTLENGSKWILYKSYVKDDGTISTWYASKKLDVQNRSERDYYLTVHFNGNNILWTDEADIMNDVAKFDSIVVMDPAEDPYVPQEAPAAEAPAADAPATDAPAEETAPAAESTWVCPECQQENSGNFCSNCGTARP